MKKLLLSLIGSIVFPLFLFAQSQSGIIFNKQGTWPEILARAKKENKYIFVDAYTTWCGPCKEMDVNTYPDSALGKLMNERYISVKVQMDSTGKDDAYVRSWYQDATMLKQSAKVVAYPTLLFYYPNGDLALNTIGFKDANAVKVIADFISDPATSKEFPNALQAYREGKKEYKQMISLSRVVKQVLDDQKLASQIAKDYYTGYLERCSLSEFTHPENIKFIGENGIDLTRINDRFFQLCYKNPVLIDSILAPGAAKSYINALVSRDAIEPMLYDKNRKAITTTPNWERIITGVSKKYAKADVIDLVRNLQPVFYRGIKSWERYTYYNTEQIKRNPPKPGTLEVFFKLNAPAWDVFEHCEDTTALKRALDWSIQSIELENNVQFLDTKANLLYKLNRKQEAIALQEEALIQDQKEAQKKGKKFQYRYIAENLAKMKKGEPTWIVNQ